MIRPAPLAAALLAGALCWITGSNGRDTAPGYYPHPSGAAASTIRLRPPVPAWCAGAYACWAPVSATTEAAADLDLTGNGRPLSRQGTTTWAAGAGISWSGEGGYIATPVAPDSTDVTVLVRVSGCTITSGRVVFGARSVSPTRLLQVYGDDFDATVWAGGSVVAPSYASRPTSGVYGIGPGYGLVGGEVRSTWSPAGAGPGRPIYIGAANVKGTAGPSLVACTIRSAGIWMPALSSSAAASRAADLP